MKRLLLYIAIALCLTGCSSKHNTSRSRFWQAFTTRYNVYYNGHTAYEQGIDEQLKGNIDNYLEPLPLFPCANEASRGAGGSNFNLAIAKAEKAIALHSIKAKPIVSPNAKRTPQLRAFLNKKEYNPFLKHVWLMMGKAQFQQGDYLNAASTFSYITRLYSGEPDVVQEARVWLARCYAGENWFYDADDVIDRLQRDTIPSRLRRELAATRADLLLRQGRYDEALPHLQTALKNHWKKEQKARLYYLLAQTQQQLHLDKEAYKSLSRVRRLNPSYRLALNAQILQTQLQATPQQRRHAIGRLRRMVRSEKNKKYLAQVNFALGNLYLQDADTARAIAAYEYGRKHDKESSVEKGMLLMQLGEIYWTQHKFGRAQKAYTEALSMIDTKHKAYQQTALRSRVLDRLAPYTDAIELQDSLLQLAHATEAERNAAIDRAIAQYKQEQKELERERRNSEGSPGTDFGTDAMTGAATGYSGAGVNNKAWYFYNTQRVQMGRQEFERRWGNRPNEDDWRRSNKTVVKMDSDAGYDYDADADSLQSDSVAADSTAIAGMPSKDDPRFNPLKREYYLKNIPLEPEQQLEAHEIIKDALFNAAVIEKDALEDLPLSLQTFNRLLTDYPDTPHRADAYYHLFLLYSRMGDSTKALQYRNLMAEEYPNDLRTRKITDPDYMLLARHGREMEDSLYRSTYEAYRNRDNAQVARNFALSTQKFPQGQNRPKFIFVNALSRLATAPADTLISELTGLVTDYPKSDVSEMAGMIVNGLRAGRQIGTGSYDIGSLWTLRNERTAATNAGQTEEVSFSPKRNVPFVFVAAYPQDSLQDNQLLYDFAHFNFTSFFVRHFEIEKTVGLQPAAPADTTATQTDTKAEANAEPGALRRPQLVQFRIHGFQSFDEAHTYAQRLSTDAALASQLSRARTFLISEENLLLLGSYFSIADYQAYYDSHYTALAPVTLRQLDTQTSLANQRYEATIQPIYPRAVRPTAADSLMALRTDSILRAVSDTIAAAPVELIIEDEDGSLYPLDYPDDEEPIAPATNDVPLDDDNPLLPQQKEPAGYPDEPATPQKTEEKKTDDLPLDDQPAKTEPNKDDDTSVPEDDDTPMDDDEGEWYPE